ncbi:MAG: alpha amylase C-terminal domain-containing protein, partial [Lutibacter sp.]|nr:alpha amylase C-terminal domain-containing protein [Lutibacter sp.]
GNENAGFGAPTRTSIFDYIGVPNHQKWMNNGKFDGGQLTVEQKELRDFYKRLLNFTLKSDALMGNYQEIHSYNRAQLNNYNHRLFSFVRWSNDVKLIIISNFDAKESYELELKLPKEILAAWNLKATQYHLIDQLYGTQKADLKIENGEGTIKFKLGPLASYIFKVQEN